MAETRHFINEMVSELEREFTLMLERKKVKHPAGGAGTAESVPDATLVKGSLRELLAWMGGSNFSTIASLPFIYGMIVPFLILDLSVTVYQAVCFRLYRIPRVKKADYIALERHQLGYLNLIEKIHCDYCGYANGLMAFCREILARTEQYFCPIKHANKVLGTHQRYASFLEYGDEGDYQAKLESLRQALLNEKSRL